MENLGIRFQMYDFTTMAPEVRDEIAELYGDALRSIGVKSLSAGGSDTNRHILYVEMCPEYEGDLEEVKKKIVELGEKTPYYKGYGL